MKGKEGREEAGILSALAPWIDSSRISVIPGRLSPEGGVCVNLPLPSPSGNTSGDQCVHI